MEELNRFQVWEKSQVSKPTSQPETFLYEEALKSLATLRRLQLKPEKHLVAKSLIKRMM